MNTSDSIVIIPTYNEKENIEKLSVPYLAWKRVSTYSSLTMVHPMELRRL